MPILQAYAEGKVVQMQESDNSPWYDLNGNVAFSSPPHRYRIKPEPREWWVCPHCRDASGIKEAAGKVCCGPEPRVHVKEVL